MQKEIPVVQEYHGSAKNSQHCASHQSDRSAFDTVGETGRQKRSDCGQGNAYQHDIPLFQDDGGMDEDMGNGCDQSGECHDECAGSNGCLKLHAKKRGEHHQHHHAAAGSDKPCSKTNRQTEKQGYQYTFPVKLLPFWRSVFTAGIGFDEKTDADAERQKQREAAKHDIAGQIGRIAADGAHA